MLRAFHILLSDTHLLPWEPDGETISSVTVNVILRNRDESDYVSLLISS